MSDPAPLRPVIWLGEAKRERNRILARIRRENRRAALRIGDELVMQTARLARLPFIGRPGRVPGTRELSINRTPYLVIYRVTEGAVHILRVLHSRQQWPQPD